jgi:hypothetical protein
LFDVGWGVGGCGEWMGGGGGVRTELL